MSDTKRYTFDPDCLAEIPCECSMEECKQGEYVLYEDYATQTARADAAMKFARHDTNCTYHKGVQYAGDCSCGFDKFKRGNYEKP